MLYSFNYVDGVDPNGSLKLSGAMLYGMTSGGGAHGEGPTSQINTSGTGFQVLHSFGSKSNDGVNPHGSFTLAGSTLYGMTSGGGAHGEGTIFSLSVTPGEVPGTPTRVTATAGNARATVSFKLPASGGNPITVCTAVSKPGGIIGYEVREAR